MLTIATKVDFDQTIKENDCLIVVDFFATWCGPCKTISPTIEGFSKEFTDVIFVKIDVDENSETAESCDIRAMPTFQFYKGGKKVGEVIGVDAKKIKDLIVALK
uniref:Thioredoxin n=1 Tax=Arion vulgaris TaxID=1028688 RepID=A0A0B7AJW5_9EUPU